MRCFASSTAFLFIVPSAAFAQQAPDQAAPPADAVDSGDIVVTATKQSTLLSRVPLSITALTQQTMDRANVRTFNDIIRTVPGLALGVNPSADRNPSISVRGISSSGGAPTTGIYVDDIPLQKRTAVGISGSGTPIPHLFDLDRVEVLRGPQGTLFGGSSLGGTIRFITPTPNLDTPTLYSRSEVSSTKDGGISFQAGAAVGVPLIEGKLALRVSADVQRDGGYIDHVNRFTGATIEKDTNTGTAGSYRAALLFAPNERLRITPSFYYSYDDQDNSSTQWASIPSRTVDDYTYPAVHFDRNQSGNNCNIGDDFAVGATPCVVKQPRKQRFFVPSLKIEDSLGFADLTSVSSYIDDRTSGAADYSYVEAANFQGGYPFVHNLALYRSTPVYENTRNGFTQELRLSSHDTTSPFSWVVGGFYSHYNNNSNYHINANLADLTQAVFGAPPIAIFRVDVEPGNVTYHRDQDLTESSLALFGEANYKITDKLKVVAGGRVSRERFSYHQVTAGVFSGFIVPTVANGGLTDGTIKETPVTPRFGLQYQADDRTMLYATASKGFRVGGVNQPPPASRCAADLAALNISSTPGTYKSDHLWSYEVGAKGRIVGNLLSFDVNAFRIDWSEIQIAYGLPTCGFGYTINGGKAVSQGGDLQAAVHPFAGFTLSGEVSYTDAHYTRSVIGPAPGNAVYVQAGDSFGPAAVSFNVSTNYEVPIGAFRGYVNATYQHNSAGHSGTGPGTPGYLPDNYQIDANNYVTARLGIARAAWDLSIFADNLLNSKEVLATQNGRSGCDASTGAACTAYSTLTAPLLYTTFRPRTIGVTFSVRR
ncbi:TonB-dependent receptor [Sphingomonas sp. MMS12-HWE2-04]|uniref:TonB-dependent receptor n=1 Tax=Sphingomonas sp. MMS12-HWE2-04 TaxID=3234199 RepID=UPI00384C726B